VLHLARLPLFDGQEEMVGRRLLSTAEGSGSPGGLLAGLPGGADGELVLAEEMHGLAPRGLVLLSVSREELLGLRALSLPAERFVLCPRLSGPLDEDLRGALERHSMRGFRLAVDSVGLAALGGPLLGGVRTVIVELGASESDQLARTIAAVRERVGPAELMAAGVHSRASFEICRRLGFDLFQGQFFLRPTGRPKRTVAEAGLGGLGTMAELAATESFEQLAAIITRDPGLSMRLLRYANSAHMALPRRVGSVHEALAWMGTVTVREFALVAAVASVNEAPAEMLATALTRARMCQQLARRLPATNPEESFTVGLFSVAEAVADAPIGEVVAELPLREDVASALVGGAGELGRLLGAVVAYECGDFASAKTLSIGAGAVAEAYLEALHWADSAVKALG
jgi:EAL and modified HD-GYP domain-containing signal transduction protein